MKKYYQVFKKPFLYILMGQFSEKEHETLEAAREEAEVITKENPLVIAEIFLIEGNCYNIVETISKVRMG